MTVEIYSEKLWGNEKPFQSLYKDENIKELQVLNLNRDSTAEEVRRVAISMRRQMQEKGLNTDSVKALQWALQKTRDFGDDKMFLLFLLTDFTPDEMLHMENYRRLLPVSA